MEHSRKSPRNPVISTIVFLTILAAGLLLGTESTLILTRSSTQQVTAVNSWRFMGKLPLVSRSVSGVTDARMMEVSLSERQKRSTAHRNAWGMLTVPDELVIIGDSQLAYPYREDLGLIRSFLKNRANTRAESRHPIDIRRKVASFVLLSGAPEHPRMDLGKSCGQGPIRARACLTAGKPQTSSSRTLLSLRSFRATNRLRLPER